MEKKKETLPFYATAAWRRVRRAALNRDGGMCQICMQRMRDGYGIRPRRAEMVHHRIPVRERPDLALDLDNLVSLCNQCHADMHPEKYRAGETRKGQEKEEQIRASGIRVIKV